MHRFDPCKWKTADGCGNPNVTNGDRARWAESAVEAFKGCTHNSDGGVAEEHAVDLLADLMHLCNREQIEFDDALASARSHYQAER
jgi:hypothetical protein